MIKTTNKEFKIKLKIKNENIINTEKYKTAKTKIKFKCLIDGNEWEAKPNNILSGKGCPVCSLNKRIKKLIKQNKVLEDNGDWVLIDVSTEKYPNIMAKFDKDDFLGFKRRIYVSDQKYCMVHPEGNRGTVKAHRILNPDWKITDHINGDRSDNRRVNLRECTQQQNSWNSKIRCNNKSGYAGVWWNDRTKKWQASIKVNYKKINLGSFIDKDDAIKIRKIAETKYFGEYSRK